MGGALSATELTQVVEHVGLADGSIVQSFNCFDGTAAAAKLPPDFQLRGVNFRAHKPK